MGRHTSSALYTPLNPLVRSSHAVCVITYYNNTFGLLCYKWLSLGLCCAVNGLWLSCLRHQGNTARGVAADCANWMDAHRLHFMGTVHSWLLLVYSTII